MPQNPSFFAGDDDPQGQYLQLKDVDGDGLEVMGRLRGLLQS